MKRAFLLIISVFASAGAADTFAQARRVRRPDPPKDERAEKPETKSEAQDEAKNGAQREEKAQDNSQDGTRAGDDKPLTGSAVTTRAVIKSKPNPGYPPEARAYGVQGVVKLRIILGSDGKVRDDIEVLEGLPHGVTEEAIKAARRIKFEPARKDDRPVSQYVTVIYHFNLH
jgi:TonB family protein